MTDKLKWCKPTIKSLEIIPLTKGGGIDQGRGQDEDNLAPFNRGVYVSSPQ